MGVIGGLAFNGWGLRTQSDQLAIQAQQAKEQTKTIQDEEERNLQERAVRVSVQPLAPFDTGRRLVVVVNRSATPIYQLRVYVAFSRTAGDSKHGDMNFVTFGSLSGCTSVKIDLKAVADDFPATRGMLSAGRPMDYGVTFADAFGKGFHRHAAGELNPRAWLEPIDNGVDSPDTPQALEGFTKHANPKRRNVFGALHADVASRQYGVVGTPSKADLCVNG